MSLFVCLPDCRNVFDVLQYLGLTIVVFGLVFLTVILIIMQEVGNRKALLKKHFSIIMT